jgi:hypothetical protein
MLTELIFLKMTGCATLMNGRYHTWGKKIDNEVIIMRMLNKSWKRIIGNTIEWRAFCLANKASKILMEQNNI